MELYKRISNYLTGVNNLGLSMLLFLTVLFLIHLAKIGFILVQEGSITGTADTYIILSLISIFIIVCGLAVMKMEGGIALAGASSLLVFIIPIEYLSWFSKIPAAILVFTFTLLVIKHLFFSGFGAHKLESPSYPSQQEENKEAKGQ